MNSATYALLLLVVTGGLAIVGLWQLLAGGSRKAQLALRGQAGGVESGGRSLVRGGDHPLPRPPPRPGGGPRGRRGGPEQEPGQVVLLVEPASDHPAVRLS